MSEEKMTTLKQALQAAGLEALPDEDLKHVVGACDNCKKSCITCLTGGQKAY